MNHDQLDPQPRSRAGHQAGREDQHQPDTDTAARPQRSNAPQALHGNGVEPHQSVPERERENDHQEERLVALIRQEVRQEVTQFYFEAQPQLHSPEALEGYKQVDPDMPNRIVAMAEREQRAQIDADLLPIRAEAYAYKYAVTVITAFPLLLIIMGIILVLNGKDSAGYIAAVAGIIGGGAQMIGQVRPSRQGRSRDAGEATARHKKPR